MQNLRKVEILHAHAGERENLRKPKIRERFKTPKNIALIL